MRNSFPIVLLLGAFVAAAAIGCGDDEDSPTTPADPYQATIDAFQLAPLPTIPYPPNNRFNAQRIALGQLLFFDPILGGESAPWIKSAAGKDPYRSRGNDIACGTCHHPGLAFADGRNLGAGVSGAQFHDTDLGPQRVVPGRSLITGNDVGLEPRNSMTILNTGFNGRDSMTPVAESFQFMDGRVTEGLEQQATLPITSREEMAGDAYGLPELGAALTKQAIQDSVARRVAGIPEYVTRFRQAFPGEVDKAADITIDHVSRAIAAYERELITPNSRFDQFVSGRRDVFSDEEKHGFELFFGKGKCGECHAGPMLCDFTFRVQGVGDGYDQVRPGFPGKNGQGGDFGRFHADEVQFADHKYEFRVLTVRNAAVTGPYFHSGSAGTLRELVEFYNRGGLGGHDISNATLAAAGVVRDPAIQPLGLGPEEIDAVVAFMRTTTAPVQPGPSGLDLTRVPDRVPSGLLPPGIPTPPGNPPGPFYPQPGDLR